MVGGWWANQLQTLALGLVLTLTLTLGPELDNKVTDGDPTLSLLFLVSCLSQKKSYDDDTCHQHRPRVSSLLDQWPEAWHSSHLYHLLGQENQ